ncbi:MAG: DUF1800 domain-containing protein [Pseudomonadota bacterium]
MRAISKNGMAATLAACLLLASCGGGGGDSSVPPAGATGGTGGGTTTSGGTPQTSVSVVESETEAVQFLTLATFGGSKSDISSLTGQDASEWLAGEFSKRASYTLPTLAAQPRDTNARIENDRVDELYWDHIITANDQVRQRMAFALSQIVVYSDSADNDQLMRAYYQDILIRNAFGNFRDLLREVTYSPAMAEWLTYLRNRKGDENTGRMPDENYAREVLQLFSIGLIELNMDGTPRLDGQGQQIETYTNDDIIGLARVFTGLSYAGDDFWDTPDDGDIQQLQMYPDQHSPLEKTFLGTTIPAGTPGIESIDTALDTIFAHPNVAPFISRQLIQRFTQSNPSPAYIQSVATAFETGSFAASNGRQFGTGVRGDLQATLAAVLLEPSLFDDTPANGTITSGKVREPILRFAHWARAFNISNVDAGNERDLDDTRSSDDGLGQQPFSSPSVFNFYRPGFIAPGTNSGNADLTVPEFQISNEGSAVGYLNFMTDFAFDRSPKRDSSYDTYDPDYSEELALASDPTALVDHLDDLLTAGRMSDEEKADIVDIISTVQIRTNSPENTAADEEDLVQTAIALVLNSPSYAVVW